MMNNTLLPILSYACAAVSGILFAGGLTLLRWKGD